MKSVRYIGWREDLKGRTAIVRHGPRSPGRILVQFDFPPQDPERGIDPGPDTEPLCFGWHDFAADQFEEITE